LVSILFATDCSPGQRTDSGLTGKWYYTEFIKRQDLSICIIKIHTMKTKELSTADVAVIKHDVTRLMENFHAELMAKNVKAMMKLMAEEGLYCGTDPKEFWNKTECGEITKKTVEEMGLIEYPIQKREIRVGHDGQSALVIDQFVIEQFSKRMPMRMISRCTHTHHGWLIDFLSWSFIPANEDLEKINKALEM